LDKLNYEELAKHISFQFIQKYLNKIKWNWNLLSSNENIPYTFWEKNLNKVNWTILSINKSIPTIFWDNHLTLCKQKGEHDKINWYYLSRTNLPISFIKKYMNKLDWYELSTNENIPFDFFNHYMNIIKWDKVDDIEFTVFREYLTEEIIKDIENRSDENIKINIDNYEFINIIRKLDIKKEVKTIKKYIEELKIEFKLVYDNKELKYNSIKFENYLNRKENNVFQMIKYKVDFSMFQHHKHAHKFAELFLDTNIKDIDWIYLIYNDNVPMAFLLKCIKKKKIKLNELATSRRMIYEDNIEKMNEILLKIL